MDDWGAVRERIQADLDCGNWDTAQQEADIRAALERDKQQSAHIKTLQEIGSKAQVEALALRQRVEELERDYAEVQDISVSESVGRRAAEAKLAAWEAAESLPDCPACAVLEGE